MKNRYIIIFIIFIFFLIVFYPILLKIIFPLLKLNNIQEYGQFGDMYGILSSFFSGFALIMIIVTYIKERIERNEDKIENEKDLKNQKNYDNFYALLNSHLKIIDHAEQGNYNASGCIARAISELKKGNILNSSNVEGYRVSLRAYFRSLAVITKIHKR